LIGVPAPTELVSVERLILHYREVQVARIGARNNPKVVFAEVPTKELKRKMAFMPPAWAKLFR